jgi:hypothetical protein
MSLIAKSSGGGDFTPAPAGTHTAVCVQCIDLGTIYSKYYDSWKPKVLLGFELIGEKNEQGEAFIVWKRYTNSLHENAVLRGHLESWRGKAFTSDELDGFALTNVLDKPCLISVSHRVDGNKTYADVGSVMALPKGTPAPKRTHDLVVFDIEDPDMEVFGTFREGLQDTIKGSKEWQDNPPGHLDDASTGRKPTADDTIDDPDDIPF